MVITSLNNEHIKELNKLKEKKYRDQEGLFLLEGEHLVIEALKHNTIEELIVLDGITFDSKNIKTTIVSKEVMKKLSSMDSYPTVIGVSKKLEEKALPQDIDYLKIDGLRLEARQKLDKIRPKNLGQAGRISGVSPADIAVLMVYLKR